MALRLLIFTFSTAYLFACSSNRTVTKDGATIVDVAQETGTDSGDTADSGVDAAVDGTKDVDPPDFVVMPDSVADAPQPPSCPPFSGASTKLKLHQSPANEGDWTIALAEPHDFSTVAIAPAGPKQTIATFDYTDISEEVAGFVTSRTATATTAEGALAAVLSKIRQAMSGTVMLRASGRLTKSHDGFEMIRNTTLDLKLPYGSYVSAIRNEVAAALAAAPLSSLTGLPKDYGATHASFVIRLAIVHRGNAPTTKQWVVIGAIAAKDNYHNHSRQTGFIVDDLSNGTALARANATLVAECQEQWIDSPPAADIIWVIDESGSMSDNRADLINNANDLYAYAILSGLDFRMGVTNVCSPLGSTPHIVGKFCSTISSVIDHDGGADRFLNFTEQAIFSSCVMNPPGHELTDEYGMVNAVEAINKHLPRAPNLPNRIRTDAHLAVVIVSDENPGDLSNTVADAWELKDCNPGLVYETKIETWVQPHLSLFKDPTVAASVYFIGGVCDNSCGADQGHGYRRVALRTGGQIADLCQKDIGNSLYAFMNAIVGAASPKLSHVPVSASLETALEGTALDRSRTSGYDYHSSHNAVGLRNIYYQKGSPLVTRYYRFK